MTSKCQYVGCEGDAIPFFDFEGKRLCKKHALDEVDKW